MQFRFLMKGKEYMLEITYILGGFSEEYLDGCYLIWIMLIVWFYAGAEI